MSRAGAVGRRRDPAAASRGVVVPFGELGRSSVKKLPSRERVYWIVMDPISILWLFIILASLQPAIQRRFLEVSRQRTLSRLASERSSTVITLIHRQETMSFLGIPIVRYINIDDSEGVLSAVRATSSGTPIDIV